MGVMRCVREGCENIMCDRYSFTYGHICNECFDFLQTDKKSFKNRYDEIDKEFPNLIKYKEFKYV